MIWLVVCAALVIGLIVGMEIEARRFARKVRERVHLDP